MTRVRSLSILGVLALAACSEVPVTPTASLVRGPAASARLTADGTDSYVVKFKGGVPADFSSAVSALGGEVIWTHEGLGLAGISGLTEAGAATLNASAGVAQVEVDGYSVLDDPTSMTVEAADAPADVVESQAQPNLAAFYPRQWHLRVVGAQTAWANGKLGKSTTRVGILDTGIGYTGIDLAGLVDLAASRSFLNSAENARVVARWGAAANLVADLHYHGSHVASTVASNGLATAGVTSKTTLVGIKVCAPGVPNDTASKAFVATCPTSAVLGGILYAADQGLDVINMSLGGAFYRRDGSARGGFPPSFIAIINSVFNYAHKKGTAVVVSAGNSRMDMDHNGNIYVAYCNAPHVICVSATGPTAQQTINGPWTNIDNLASYSNFGRTATVAAPGGNASSSVWASCSRMSIAIPVCTTGTFGLGLQGTSMAAPHVTGLAALIAAEVGHNPDAIAARIIGSADDLGAPGTDMIYGRGRINVARGLGL